MSLRCLKRRDSYSSVRINQDEGEANEKRRMWLHYLIIFGIILLSIILLLLILVFIGFPLAFMWSIKVQRFFMFININSPSDPNFENPSQYGIEGVTNFYITVEDLNSDQVLSLGAWHIQPEAEAAAPATNVTVSLRESRQPILLYFHGVGCNRAKAIPTYRALRKHFRVIAIDYRDFGDSTGLDLSENAVVDDVVQVYTWALSKTGAPLYVWGHSLGTAISTHTVKMLKFRNIQPMGLVLESPFSTMHDEMPRNPIGKFFAWLFYFDATFQDPLAENGFHFNTISNILHVDCPIMIMHAEDDNIIPFDLGEKLYQTVSKNRGPHQGNVTFHKFEASLGYKHVGITTDPRISRYVEEFIAICESYKMQNNM